MPALVQADPLEELERYFFQVETLEGRFVQETRDERGSVLETSEGKLALARPDRFHWEYESPFPQDILADGERLWVYDHDLEQVSVRPMEEVLGSGPALMLSGNLDSLEEQFELSTDGEWILMEPRESGWEVSEVRLKMVDGLPSRVIVKDGLGQINELTLSDLRQNVSFDGNRFRFDPPEGVDVVGQ
ncbi:MAG: outer membrane lipoprotein chaperone LolA [Ectothiorhodospiraceae bacterium]|nr:outer membrane lipoprotein chaperone LolA [Ectothiorhodospiraceae bacterium]